MNDENEPVKIKVVDAKSRKVLEYIMTKEDSDRSKTKLSAKTFKLRCFNKSGKTSFENKTYWKYESTVSLMNSLERRHKEFYSPDKKKVVWINIAKDLKKQGFEFNPQTCSRKWQNLLRTYKICHMNLNSHGKLPYRFPYYKKMNRVLLSKPSLMPKRFLSMDMADMEDENKITYLKTKDPENDNCIENDDFYFHEESHTNEDKNLNYLKNEKIEVEDYHWSKIETLSLIYAIKSHYKLLESNDDTLWTYISNELQSNSIEVSPKLCKTKWLGLYDIYNKSKNGEIQGNFIFFEEIDNLLNPNSRISAETSDEDPLRDKVINGKNELILGITDETEDDGLNLDEVDKKFGIDIQYNGSHLNMVEPVNIELMESENGYDYTEKFALWKRKLDLEERKVKVLEDLLNFCRGN